jgi:hypothetical protein
MTYFYLKLASAGLVVWFMTMLLIRSQPYDDHELRALLMPKDCEMPCFMGIRPGVTTVDEAVKILENSEWVKQDEIITDKASGSVSWSWTSDAPSLIATTDFGSLDALDNIVHEIYISTLIPLSDIWLIMGIPPDYVLTGSKNSYFLFVNNFYADYGFGVYRDMVLCPYFSNLLESRVTIFFFRARDYEIGLDESFDQFFRKRVIELDRRDCKG